MDDAKSVDSGWSDTLFGGNKGLRTAGQQNTCGIIKHVHDEDITQEEIKQKIGEEYEDATCEFFTRGPQKDPTGVIKIDFKKKEVLEKALADRIIVLNQQRYILEEFVRKPQVIKCNRCQAFGHVHRLCRAQTPKCGKCCSTKHETIACTAGAGQFKCAHCNENHQTGSKECATFKKKMDELHARFNYD